MNYHKVCEPSPRKFEALGLRQGYKPTTRGKVSMANAAFTAVPLFLLLFTVQRLYIVNNMYIYIYIYIYTYKYLTA